ncbi:ester cyclase [Roseivivax isoporae]|uniref:Polyketide cyclase n=1 Tax=Roseivivax isoporae LMG 25204 TaxID=1449351 RepID=X7F5K8_9RHOB|nr:ester cyclase [Roseivivax isoporae]ETX28207.1 polyketide cyclase [Roseivivax isoporae LMG 25204]
MKDLDHGPEVVALYRHIAAAIWQKGDFSRPVDTHLDRDVTLAAPEGTSIGRVAVATDALGPLAAFPDQRWFVEDSFAAPGRGAESVLSDRRAIDTVHAGEGVYGPPTGRRLRFRVLTEARMQAGRITALWRVTDRAAILAALGRDPVRWAEDMLRRDPEVRARIAAPPAADDAPGARGDGWGTAWADMIERAMEGAFGVFEDQYDAAADLVLPGGVQVQGPDAARGFWLGLRSAFPSARFEVVHAMALEAPLMPPRAALRWTLEGRHDGWGPFGAPTGAEVRILGLSQAEFGPDGLRREWTLHDPAATWLQILAGR